MASFLPYSHARASKVSLDCPSLSCKDLSPFGLGLQVTLAHLLWLSFLAPASIFLGAQALVPLVAAYPSPPLFLSFSVYSTLLLAGPNLEHLPSTLVWTPSHPYSHSLVLHLLNAREKRRAHPLGYSQNKSSPFWVNLEQQKKKRIFLHFSATPGSIAACRRGPHSSSARPPLRASAGLRASLLS